MHQYTSGEDRRNTGTGSDGTGLTELGWSPFFEAIWKSRAAPEGVPARVIAIHRGELVVAGAFGERRARTSGRLRHMADDDGMPAVGDWIALELSGDGMGLIHEVLPRRSKFARKQAGNETREQVVAANIDILFVVAALNEEFNVRRLERYVTVAWDGGAQPVIALNKADICADLEDTVAEAEAIANGVPVHAVSAVTGLGLEALGAYVAGRKTAALVGSSGVGKSSLVNALAGSEVMTTRAIRADGRGRHTTTHRELIVLPSGGLLLDTPGMRELQLWAEPEGAAAAFEDVVELARGCKFGDCSHETEPGCAVRGAVASGELTEERLESYQKLTRELRHLQVKQDKRLQSETRKKWRQISRANRENYRSREGRR